MLISDFGTLSMRLLPMLDADGGGGNGDGSAARASPSPTGDEVATGASPIDGGQTQAKPDFRELIKGDYREDFQRETQAIINKRFKDTKALRESNERMNSLLAPLAQKYGLEAGDLDGLQRAIDGDNALWEEEAAKRGMSVEQYRQITKNEQELQALKRAVAERDEQEKFAQYRERIAGEAAQLQAMYPNFDLREEMNNPQFANLMNPANNIPLQTVYEIVHKDELFQNGMRFAVEKTTKATADSIATKSRRPIENGGAGQASGKPAAKPITALSRPRAKCGEKIDFRT